MNYVEWSEVFDIMKDGDYLGYSDPIEPEEVKEMKFYLSIDMDSSYILDTMNKEQSYVWSAYLSDGNVVIINGFENDADWYYIGRKKCKKTKTSTGYSLNNMP